VKRFVKWIFYVIAATFGSELGSRFEQATMSTHIFLDGKEVKGLTLQQLAKQFQHMERLTSTTEVNLWDILSFTIPGGWATYVPEPLFSIVCLVIAWKLLRRW